MKTGIHPNYKTVMVKCTCGNEFESGSVKEETALRLVLNVTHSTLVVKNSLKLVAVLIASTKNTVLNNHIVETNRQVA